MVHQRHFKKCNYAISGCDPFINANVHWSRIKHPNLHRSSCTKANKVRHLHLCLKLKVLSFLSFIDLCVAKYRFTIWIICLNWSVFGMEDNLFQLSHVLVINTIIKNIFFNEDDFGQFEAPESRRLDYI